MQPIIEAHGLVKRYAGQAMIMTARAQGYDFFSYYVTLLLTPMFILSGVFYPVSSLPSWLQTVVQILPLTHAADLLRPLVSGQPLSNVVLHLAVLTAYAIVGFAIAVRSIRRRLLV